MEPRLKAIQIFSGCDFLHGNYNIQLHFVYGCVYLYPFSPSVPIPVPILWYGLSQT